MQALNHVSFGSLIAIMVPIPALAAVVSLGSHFALDTIPHYGEDERAPRGSRPYLTRIVVDALLSVLDVIIGTMLWPEHAKIIMLCAFLAILPDLLWPLAYVASRTGLLWKFFVFHKTIQQESRGGARVEVIWLLSTVSLFVFIKHS